MPQIALSSYCCLVARIYYRINLPFWIHYMKLACYSLRILISLESIIMWFKPQKLKGITSESLTLWGPLQCMWTNEQIISFNYEKLRWWISQSIEKIFAYYLESHEWTTFLTLGGNQVLNVSWFSLCIYIMLLPFPLGLIYSCQWLQHCLIFPPLVTLWMKGLKVLVHIREGKHTYFLYFL